MMKTDLYTYENLRRIALKEDVKPLIDEIKKKYEETYLGKAPIEFKYSDFKRIYIDGNRSDWQSYTVDVLNEFSYLRVLALVDDAYLEPLEESIFRICNQFTWVWPAHSYLKDGKFDYGFIDLRSAEYSFFLSETMHVFKDKLSVDIRDRIISSIKSKVIDNYENRDFWWEEELNNWLTVCAGSIGMAYLYCFPERFDGVKDRIFASLKRYVENIPDDGAYTEGVGYLDASLAYFSVFFQAFYETFGYCPDFVNSSKIRRAIKFLNNSSFGYGLMVPFSDGWVPGYLRDLGVVCANKLFYPDEYDLVKAELKPHSILFFYRFMNCIDLYGPPKEQAIKNSVEYFESSEWLIARKDNYNFIAKCGNNSEMHNHCDVGAFEINRKGVKIISDPGAAVYTYQYFNDFGENGRYGRGILLASSLAHSVPIVNGKPQYGYSPGVELVPYAGRVISHSDDSFSMDIAGVYHKGEVESLIVSYELKERSVKVKYLVRGLKESITFRFVTELKPKASQDGVDLGEATIRSASNIAPLIDCPDYQNKRVTIYTVDFPVERSGEVVEEFEIVLR